MLAIRLITIMSVTIAIDMIAITKKAREIVISKCNDSENSIILAITAIKAISGTIGIKSGNSNNEKS